MPHRKKRTTTRRPDTLEQHPALWLGSIIESSNDAIITKSLDGIITSWNPAADRIFGYTADEAVGQPLTMVFPPDRVSEEAEIMARLVAGERVEHFRTVRVRKDGTRIDVSVSITLLRDATGQIVGISKISRDVSLAVRRERELARQARLYAALSQINQAIVWTRTADDLLHKICRALVEFGQFRLACIQWRTPESSAMRTVAQWGDRSGFLPKFAAVLAQSDRLDPIAAAAREGRRYVCRDLAGDPLWTGEWAAIALEHRIRGVAAFPLRSGAELQGTLIVYADDVDAFQEREIELLDEAAMDAAFGLTNIAREDALVESERRFRQLAENISEVFWLTDINRESFLYVSPAFEAIFGRACQELHDAPSLWFESIIPDDRDRVIAAAAHQASGHYDETYRIARPDGEIRWIRDRAFPVSDDTGRPYRLVGTAQDMTERKLLEEQFLRAQRMESVGQLAGGIAHDLNNVLAPILLSVKLLRDEIPRGTGRELLDTLERSAERGADLIRQVLAVSRGLDGARIVIDPRRLIGELIQVMRETFPRSIDIHLRVADDAANLVGDPTQLNQVFLNLLVNGRDAMPAGGRLMFSVENALVDPVYATMHFGSRPGQFVKIIVADTGVGIRPEHRDRVFEPFFTTKDAGVGTGLGLSTTAAIVKSHGGFITVDSEPGRGTAFGVFLPAAAKDARAAALPLPMPEPAPGHGELILLVDDEAAIRTVAEHTLVAAGYRVLLAAHGAEAVAVFSQHSREIAVVLTDMAMPVMDGPALIAALKAMNPRVKVIASSGLTDADDIDTSGVVRQLLRKPYTAEMMLRTLQSVLNESA